MNKLMERIKLKEFADLEYVEEGANKTIFYKGTRLLYIAGAGYRSKWIKNPEIVPVEMLGNDIDAGNVLDYFCCLHLQHNIFFKNGNFRLQWITNLLERVYSKTHYFETTKRVNLLIPHLETLKKQNEALYKAVMDIVKPLYKTGELRYVYDPHLSRVNYIWTKFGKVKGELFKNKDVKFLEHADYGCYIYLPDNLEMVSIAGEELPTIVISALVETGALSYCADCGSMEWSSRLQLDVCRVCFEARYKETAMEIRSYRTRAPDVLGYSPRKKGFRYLGVELEYECGSLTKEKAASISCVGLKNHLIVKEDGSLRNGIELVTKPADRLTHLKEFKPFFEKFSQKIIHAHTTTGMHVHVEREGLSELTVGKLSHFMAAKDNQSFLTNLAGRESLQYAKLGTNDAVSHSFLKIGVSDRYKALNLSNAKTIEFRLFSTPEKYEDFAKNLEFCDGLVEFCNMNSSIKSLTHGEFNSFILKNRGAYPNLSKFLDPPFYKAKPI